MVWQDIVMMIVGFSFVPPLAFSIFKKVQMPYPTTIPTAIALTVLVVCYVTLGLFLAAFSTGLTALCWYTLAYITFSRRQRKG